MSVCSWFVIYIMFIKATVNADLSKVNIDLNTYIDIDEKDTDADIKFLIKHKKISGDVKIIIDEDDHLHRKFSGRNVLTFTDFIYSMINILKRFNDNDLEYFCAIFDDEIRKYHYQGCKFYELTENTAFRKFVANKLGIIRQKPPNTIRNTLATIADEIERINFDESKKDLAHLVNSLYKKNGVKKLKNFLNDIEAYGNTSIKNINLIKIIRNGIRSILFDHYTELHKIIRVELKNKLEEYFGNNLKTSTVIIAQITNAMILDFNLSRLNSVSKFRELDSFGNRRPNSVTIPGMRNRHLRTRRRKKLSTHKKAKIQNAESRKDRTTLKFKPVMHKKPLRIVYIKNRTRTKPTTLADSVELTTYTNNNNNGGYNNNNNGVYGSNNGGYNNNNNNNGGYDNNKGGHHNNNNGGYGNNNNNNGGYNNNNNNNGGYGNNNNNGDYDNNKGGHHNNNNGGYGNNNNNNGGYGNNNYNIGGYGNNNNNNGGYDNNHNNGGHHNNNNNGGYDNNHNNGGHYNNNNNGGYDNNHNNGGHHNNNNNGGYDNYNNGGYNNNNNDNGGHGSQKQKSPTPSKDKIQSLWAITTRLPSKTPMMTTRQDHQMYVVTMKPYFPRNVTSFGKFHYVVDLNRKDEHETKIPGLLFAKPLRIMGVGTAGIGEEISTPGPNKKDISVLRREVEEEKNIIFYRRAMDQTIDDKRNKPPRFQRINLHKFNYNRRSNGPLSLKSGHNINKGQKKENVFINLRINVDDYLKKMNITPNRWNENSRKRLESNKVRNNQYKGKPFFRGAEYKYDDFIRGKSNNWYQHKKENHSLNRSTVRDPFIKGPVFNNGGSSTSSNNDNLNSNKEGHQIETTQSYFNNNTNEEHDDDQKHVTSNTLETVIIENVESQEDETHAKSNKDPLHDTDKEEPKSHSPDQTDQSCDINHNKSKNNDNFNVGSKSFEDNKEEYRLIAGAGKELHERKQTASNEDIKVTESKEKQSSNNIYFNRDIKDDDGTNEPHTETIVELKTTRAPLNFFPTRNIGKEDIEENKQENEWIRKPKSRFKIQSRNNNISLLNTDINQTQTNDPNIVKNDEISTFNMDGKQTNAINRRNYIHSRFRNYIERQNNNNNKIKGERYNTEGDRSKNQNNENDELSNARSNNIEQNINEQKNDKITDLVISDSDEIITENPMEFSDQTTSPIGEDQIEVGTITSFDLSREITAPDLNETDLLLLKKLEEREELAIRLESKAKRRMNQEKQVDIHADKQLVNEDFNLTSIYSEEVTNDGDLFAPSPTLPNDFE